MTGFYYHTDDFEGEEVITKCVKRLDGIPEDFNGIEIQRREETPPADLIDSQLTKDWVAPNYTDTITEFDVPVINLNDKSKEKEIKRLEEQKGQLFVLEGVVKFDDTTTTVSALIEIRGRASGGKTEFFIEEYCEGESGI